MPRVKPPIALAACKAIVFDLDGTLIDSVGDMRQAMSRSLVECGLPALPDNYVMPNMHGPACEVIHAMLSDRQLPLDRLDAMHQAYYHHYSAQENANSTPYAGAMQFLGQCRQRGLSMAVCTNKRESIARDVLQTFGMQNFFPVVVGGDTTDRPKPDAKPLLQALAGLGIDAHDAIFVGDTHVDALCAQRSRTALLFHTAGYGDEAVFQHPVLASFGAYAELA